MANAVPNLKIQCDWQGNDCSFASNYWDVSSEQNETIVAWLEDNGSNGYILKFSSSVLDIPILANKNSSYLFYNSKVADINFNDIFKSDEMTSTAYMFNGASDSSIDLSSWTNNPNLTNVTYMFSEYGTIDGNFMLDGFDTSKVTDFSHMFYNTKANTIDINIDTSSATNMSYMFGAGGYGDRFQVNTLDLSSFDTSNVTNFSYMFGNSTTGGSGANIQTLDISSFTAESATTMKGMFRGANIPTIDLSSMTITNGITLTDMLSNTNQTTIAYAKTDAGAAILNDATKTGKPTTYMFVVIAP